MSKPLSTGAATPPEGEWQNVRAIATVAFERAVTFYLSDIEKRGAQVLELMSIVGTIREYALTRNDLTLVWDRLRQNTRLLDIILYVTSEIALLNPRDLGVLAAEMGHAVHVAIPREFRDGKWMVTALNATDSAFLESVSQEKHLVDILTNNPWAMTLLILKQCGIFSVR